MFPLPGGLACYTYARNPVYLTGEGAMLRRWFILLSLVLVTTLHVAGGCGLRAVTTSPPHPDPLPAQIDTYLQALSDDGVFSGAVLVACDSEPILRQGYGMAIIEYGVPNTPMTRFRISSLTKAFTAMAVLQLQAAGRLRLIDPISDYLDDCPDQWRTITLHHLLTHTAGIPDYVTVPGFWETTARQHLTLAELTALFSDAPLHSPPGTQFYYSNSNYVLLASVVARISDPGTPSDQAFAAYLQRNIFDPLGMADTGIELCRQVIPEMATGYSNPAVRASYCDPAPLFGMGDLYSTVDDLWRWEQALAGGGPFPGPMLSSMFHAYTYSAPISAFYGYGWYMRRCDGLMHYWHTGSTPGYRSYMLRVPEAGYTLIILSNLESTPLFDMADTISALVLAADHARTGF